METYSSSLRTDEGQRPFIEYISNCLAHSTAIHRKTCYRWPPRDNLSKVVTTMTSYEVICKIITGRIAGNSYLLQPKINRTISSRVKSRDLKGSTTIPEMEVEFK